MICAEISAFELLFFTDSEGWVLGRKWVDPSRLDDCCVLIADFFIEAKKDLPIVKGIERCTQVYPQTPDFNDFRFYIIMPLSGSNDNSY